MMGGGRTANRTKNHLRFIPHNTSWRLTNTQDEALGWVEEDSVEFEAESTFDSECLGEIVRFMTEHKAPEGENRLNFTKLSPLPNRKTERWQLTLDVEELGTVQWRSGWRRYVIGFENDSPLLLSDIRALQLFLKDETDKRRSQWK